MKKLFIIVTIFLLGCVLSAGCVENPIEEEKPQYTYGFYDKSPYYYPMDLKDHMTYYTEWTFVYEDATGFDIAERREATENRYSIFSLTPGATGCIPVEITAPKERDVTVTVGNHPENEPQAYPQGFSAVLADGSVVVPAGQTVTAPLYISLAEDAADNNHNPTLITLEVQSGARIGHWCLLLNSEDPYIPEY